MTESLQQTLPINGPGVTVGGESNAKRRRKGRFRFSTFVALCFVVALVLVSGAFAVTGLLVSEGAVERDSARLENQTDTIVDLVTQSWADRLSALAKFAASDSAVTRAIATGERREIERALGSILYGHDEGRLDVLLLMQPPSPYHSMVGSGLYDFSALPEQVAAFDRTGTGQGAWYPLTGDREAAVLLIGRQVVEPEFGRIVGTLYAGIIINDNLALLRDLQEATGANAVGLVYGGAEIAHFDADSQSDADSQNEEEHEGAGMTMIALPLLPGFFDAARGGPTAMLHLPASAKSQIGDSVASGLGALTAAIIVICALATWIMMRMLNREIGSLTGFAERAVSHPKTAQFSGSTFHDIDKVGQTLSRFVRALADSELRAMAMMENAEAMVFIKDLEGRYLFVNRHVEQVMGLRKEDLIGHTNFDKLPADVALAVSQVDQRIIATGKPERSEKTIRRRGSDDARNYLMIKFPLRDSSGRITGLGGIASDVTEARRTEERLRQAQKMEAVGQLTGGIAHDFNNLLAVIIGNLELLLGDIKTDGPSRRSAESAFAASERGAALTQRLLAFSRQQTLQPVALDLNATVEGIHQMLARTLGEQITIKTLACQDLWSCEADASQIENALLNLAINARDAMPSGGNLTIETANVHLDQEYATSQIDLNPGDYVMIAVADSGEGMSLETQQRAFDPFFTTKAQGKGSGLGLAMVHGFVKQSGGHVAIYSEIGHGTTIKIYLPRSQGETSGQAVPVEQEPNPSGQSERILVVEDDEAVRALTVTQLTALGYEVLEAEDGPSAIALAKELDHLDLLLTDVVLSGGMSGVEVAKTLGEMMPGLGLVHMSGYTANAISHQGRVDKGIRLLNKPFRRSQLAKVLREALSERAA